MMTPATAARPKCGVHIATEMVLTEAQAPIWLIVPDGADSSEPKCKRRTRLFWKCPTAGCFRVAAHAPTDEEEKQLTARDCPGCGQPTDADGVKRSRAMNLCSKCRRERAEEKLQQQENLKKAQRDLRDEYEKRLRPEEVTA